MLVRTLIWGEESAVERDNGWSPRCLRKKIRGIIIFGYCGSDCTTKRRGRRSRVLNIVQELFCTREGKKEKEG